MSEPPPSSTNALLNVAGPVSQRAPLLFICNECWRTFSDGSLAACSCEKPRPATGWAAMPYLFRGRYLFVELLGRGGMGAVFRAYDQAAHESPWVAVKVVQQGRPELADTLKEMFQKEVAAAQMLAQHKQFFVQVLGHDGVDPAYLVLEHVPWQTLDELLSTLPGSVDWLPPVQVARIGSALLRGVAKMHFHRIVHRDLTPSNIFVQRATEGEGYEVKITDLGLWAFDQVQGDSEALTLAGRKPSIEGTPSYMSPEQSTGEPVGAASDIHTIGSVLWELATGELPFPARGGLPSYEAVERRVDDLKTVPKRPSGMPEGLYKVLAKALAFEPAKRWPSATEMRRALEAFVNHYHQQRQRDLDVSWKSVEKMSEQVSSLREKLLPMRGLLERLGHLGAVLRALRDHREEAEPEALHALAENSKNQLEEIRGELNALASWLEFVAGQSGRIDVRALRNDPRLRERLHHDHDNGSPSASAEDRLDQQPWLERSPWMTVAIVAAFAMVLGLGYILGHPSGGKGASQGSSSPPAPTTAAAPLPRSPEPALRAATPGSPSSSPSLQPSPETALPGATTSADAPSSSAADSPGAASTEAARSGARANTGANAKPVGAHANPYVQRPAASEPKPEASQPVDSSQRDLIRKNPYE